MNHDEIGDIVRFGIEHPAVRDIAFQPVTHSGRYTPFDPMDRETVADVIHGIAQQTDGMFVPSDFIPIPCCHPTCRSATYAYVENGEVTPLPRVVEVENTWTTLPTGRSPTSGPTYWKRWGAFGQRPPSRARMPWPIGSVAPHAICPSPTRQPTSKTTSL